MIISLLLACIAAETMRVVVEPMPDTVQYVADQLTDVKYIDISQGTHPVGMPQVDITFDSSTESSKAIETLVTKPHILQVLYKDYDSHKS